FIEHLTDFDSTASYLSSYLRRKLAQARLFLSKPDVEQSRHNPSPDSSDDDTTLAQLVTWIPKVWKYLNRLSSTQSQHACPAIFGLRIFLACPIDVAASKHWFTDLWNNLFIPFLFKTRSADDAVGPPDTHGIRLSDSFDWIMATWPWPREKSEVLSAVGKGVNEVTKTDESFWTLPPASPTPSAQKHNMATPNRIALAQNRTSQDSGIISDGYLNMYGVNLERRSSKGSDGADRFSVDPNDGCHTPCASSPAPSLHSPPQSCRGCKTPEPRQNQSPCLAKRNQMPVCVGSTNSST
ncbi:Neuron navigator 2, partial [Fasciolopsis buskii]